MRIDNFFARLRHTLHDFRSARDGNVAIIFALTMLPIIGGVGAAIDYSRANYVKSACICRWSRRYPESQI